LHRRWWFGWVWTATGRAAATLRNISTGRTTKDFKKLEGLNLWRKEILGKGTALDTEKWS
jgi:hypothetical protein